MKKSSIPFQITLCIGLILLLLSLIELQMRLASSYFSFWNLSGIAFSLGFLTFWTLLYKKPSFWIQKKVVPDCLWVALMVLGSLTLSGLSYSSDGSLELISERSSDLWRYATSALFFALSACSHWQGTLLNPRPERPVLSFAHVFYAYGYLPMPEDKSVLFSDDDFRVLELA